MGTSPAAEPSQLSDPPAAAYELLPHYAVQGGSVDRGWRAAVEALPGGVGSLGVGSLGVDGPAVLDWDTLKAALTAELSRLGPVSVLDMRDLARPWEQVLARTESAPLKQDPNFDRLARGSMADLLDPAALEAARTCRDDRAGGVRLLLGPGAALCRPAVLWWADLPKRFAEAAVAASGGRNLAQPKEVAATTKRLFYVDWPLLDRHRDEFAERIDRFVDTQDVVAPTSLDGAALRATCAYLARRPFRTRPTFNSSPWGGHWAQHRLGHNPGGANTALGYELIAPESGVLLGARAADLVEVPFQMVVALAPEDVLGEAVHRRFGNSFPIRFDYLDTVGGGNLSVHCHPRADYMKEVFGWPYTQDETYYVMVATEGSKVFLGLRERASVLEFHRRAERADTDGTPFDVDAFVQSFPATPHQLYLVPAGTPHGSSAGNVVLEVSATPYLYSLRFYDWLRHDGAQQRRPVHVEHAFRNLDPTRVGPAVARHLVQSPRTLLKGDGWREELLGSLPDMFFEVRRLVLASDARAAQDTEGRFHVLSVVDGGPAMVETAKGDRHGLAYAETLAVPAAVGGYDVRNCGTGRLRLVKAQVR